MASTSGLGAAAALLDPLRDQSLVGTSHLAQLGHGLSSGLVRRAPALGRAEPEPGDLGEQVGAVACDLAEFSRAGGLLILV